LLSGNKRESAARHRDAAPRSSPAFPRGAAARARAPSRCELSHDAREALKVDRERVEAFLRDDDLDLDEAAALAIYASHALDVFETIKLAEPIDAAVHLDLRPMLEPVMGRQDDCAWCVLLVTRDSGRIFRGGPTGLRQLREVRSDVKNQHSAGAGPRPASSARSTRRSCGTSNGSPSCCFGTSSAGRSTI
jgi:hypothetical protein